MLNCSLGAQVSGISACVADIRRGCRKRWERRI